MKQGRAGLAILYSSGFGVVSLVANIALLPLVFHFVGAGPYGAWIFLITLVQYFYYADFGVGTAVLHFVSRVRGGDSSVSIGGLVATALVWSAIAGSVCVPVFILIAYTYLSRSGVSDELVSSETPLVVLSATALAVIVLRPFGTALIGLGGFVVERKLQLGGLFVRVAGTLLACLAFQSLVGVAIAEVLALVLPTIGAWLYVVKQKSFRLSFQGVSFTTWRRMTSYSLRSVSSTLASLVAIQGGTIIAGLVGSPASVSYYNAALRVYLGIRNMGQWCTAPFQTALSKSYVNAVDKAHSIMRSATFGTLLLVSSASVAILLVSDSLIRFWLGSSVPVDEVSTTLNVLLIGLIVYSLHGPLSMASAAAGRPGILFPIQLAWAISGLAIGYFLGRQFGIIGIAIGMALPLVVIEPLFFYVAQKYLSISLSLWLRQCFLPVLLIVGSGAVVGICSIALITIVFGAEGLASDLAALVGFAVSAALVSVVGRRHLPWNEFRQALNAEI